MSNIIQEKLIKEQPIPVSIEGTKKILFQMENCVCKIYLEKGGIGTGFFCKIPFNNNLLPVLITNNHVLNKNDIDNNKIINIMINSEVKKIEIDNLRKKYTNSDKNIDITIIEIKPNKDKIYNYLEIDDINKKKENIELEYKNKSIYILHNPNEELSVSYGLMNKIIDNKKIYHYCNTGEGSSGSPILSLKTFKIIGIHYGGDKNIKFNYGTFIKYAIDEFNKYNNYQNEINLICKTNEEGIENISGKKFVNNKENNTKLIINRNKSYLISEYKVRKVEKKIKNKKKANSKDMSYESKTLKNLEELKYLDTKDINNLNGMLSECSSISDINVINQEKVKRLNDTKTKTKLKNFYYGPIDIRNIVIGSSSTQIIEKIAEILIKERVKYWKFNELKFYCNKNGKIFVIEIFNLSNKIVINDDKDKKEENNFSEFNIENSEKEKKDKNRNDNNKNNKLNELFYVKILSKNEDKEVVEIISKIIIKNFNELLKK